MKKGLKLFLAGLLTAIIMPTTVFAKNAVEIYFFRGEGCPHCEEASEFFNELSKEDDYKDKFTIKEFEIWNNKSNKKLAENVAKALGDNLGGVPYIVIGDKSWNGYSSSIGDEIKETIDSLYEKEDYNNPAKEIVEKKPENNSWISIVIILGIIAFFGTIIHLSRKGIEEDEDDKPKEKKKKK